MLGSPAFSKPAARPAVFNLPSDRPSAAMSMAAPTGAAVNWHRSPMLVRARYLLPFVLAAIWGATVAPAKGLDASELALVVNRNMPDGMKLAQLYAKVRQVPDNRIIELDLPK